MTKLLDWIGYQIIMHGPFSAIDAGHWLGRWCLPHAGGHAYRNTTQEKT